MSSSSSNISPVRSAVIAGSSAAIIHAVLEPSWRGSLSILSYPTDEKVTRTVLASLTFALPTFIANSGGGNLATGLVFLGCATFYTTVSKNSDLEDPNELRQLKDTIRKCSWREVTQKYPLSHLSIYLTQEEIQQKFKETYSGARFSGIIKDYPLSMIVKYHLAPLDDTSFLARALSLEVWESTVKFIQQVSNFEFHGLIPKNNEAILREIKNSLENSIVLRDSQLRELEGKFPMRTHQWHQSLEEELKTRMKTVESEGETILQQTLESEMSIISALFETNFSLVNQFAINAEQAFRYLNTADMNAVESIFNDNFPKFNDVRNLSSSIKNSVEIGRAIRLCELLNEIRSVKTSSQMIKVVEKVDRTIANFPRNIQALDPVYNFLVTFRDKANFARKIGNDAVLKMKQGIEKEISERKNDNRMIAMVDAQDKAYSIEKEKILSSYDAAEVLFANKVKDLFTKDPSTVN